jgi:2-polyprenyl-3-methyl-5-hydroxy-6-metoxy-1,4-benzoquinol methylase
MDEAAAARAARAAAYENPRPEVVALVPSGAGRVLDLGCSSGALGAALRARDGREVVGVEVDERYAADARARLDRVVVGDLETVDLTALGTFDVLVCADVLEHLVDPWALLARAAEQVRPGGTVVVSLPNVRFWETFWQVGVRGTWPRRGEGIFDRTHLRWFTARDAWALVDGAGFDVVALERVVRLGPRYRPRADRLAAALLGRTPLRPFVTFQHLVVGRRRSGRGLTTP